MKVILLKDIPKVGKKHDIKDVPDGYGMNFLVARCLANIATPQRIAEIEKIKKELNSKREVDETELLEGLKRITGVEIVIKGRTSDKGHLFSAIHKKDILLKLKDDFGILLKEKNLLCGDSIKEVGEHKIGVFVGGKKINFRLKIEAI